jgi:two-component system chemotaxis response regulator CheY
MSIEMRILVVDDAPPMRKIIGKMLKGLGYTDIAEASDGGEALRVMRSQQVDFIICDWNMPGMTGIELLRTVRGDSKFKNLPFLMVTAESKKKNVIEAVRAGVSNYVIKPFNQKVLEEKLNAILTSSAA